MIRVRAESDQFLLACVELQTFVKWLECLFAAIDVTAPLDDRDFPRDMSIPRIQRIRWFRNQAPVRINEHSETQPGETNRLQSQQQPQRQQQTGPTPHPRPVKSVRATQSQIHLRHQRVPEPEPIPNPEHEVELQESHQDNAEKEEDEEDDEEEGEGEEGDERRTHPPRIDPMHRLSTTSYPNLAIDPFSGKWFPEHKWSSAHDLLYAKLCYSNLLFRSPRKSNYIIEQGKQWFVDWQTGRMVRVLPPNYGEIYDFFGPWQVIHTENRRL